MSLQLEQAAGGNLVLGNAALTGLSGAASTYSTNAFDYAIDGKAYSKSAVSGGDTPEADAVSGAALTLVANQAAVHVFVVNAAGTVGVLRGKVVAYSAGAKEVCPLPSIPDGWVAFAYAVVKAGATVSGTWTFGSSNWNATGIVVDTPVNLFSLPDSAVYTA
jgi:hypothetical protein